MKTQLIWVLLIAVSASGYAEVYHFHFNDGGKQAKIETEDETSEAPILKKEPMPSAVALPEPEPEEPAFVPRESDDRPRWPLVWRQTSEYSVHVDSFTNGENLSRSASIVFDMAPGVSDDLEHRDRSLELVNTCSQIGLKKGLNVTPQGRLHALIQWEGNGEKTKALRISFYKGAGDNRRKVHEIRAWFESKTPGFLPGTAEVLCRGALHEFPNKLTNEIYGVALE